MTELGSMYFRCVPWAIKRLAYVCRRSWNPIDRRFERRRPCAVTFMKLSCSPSRVAGACRLTWLMVSVDLL
jgi:hypothetical protein